MKKKVNIIKDILKGKSFDEMLSSNYGKKGTKKRKIAEKKINKIAENLLINNKIKEKEEKVKTKNK